jgi:hypothetical protein
MERHLASELSERPHRQHRAAGHGQFVQKEVADVARSAIEYPPMQKGASFNLEAVKAIAAHAK